MQQLNLFDSLSLIDIAIHNDSQTSVALDTHIHPDKTSQSSNKATSHISSQNKENNSVLRHITLSGQILAYHFKRTHRRTIGLTINEEGLSVTAPHWASYKYIETTLLEKQKWIFNKLVEINEQQRRSVIPPIRWENGAPFPYLGKSIILRFAPTTHAKSVLPTLSDNGDVLWLCLPNEANTQQIKDQVQSWIKRQAFAFFSARLNHYAQLLEVTYTRLSLSSATTRWGSCTSEGHIRLNWRLMHFSQTMVDYVVAHELAHLKEMNHSPCFWETVASIFPEYDRVRKDLNDYSISKL